MTPDREMKMHKLAIAGVLSLATLGSTFAHTNVDNKSLIRAEQKISRDWPVDAPTSDASPCSPYFDSWQEGYPGTERC
jgi:hypothetical protein